MLRIWICDACFSIHSAFSSYIFFRDRYFLYIYSSRSYFYAQFFYSCDPERLETPKTQIQTACHRGWFIMALRCGLGYYWIITALTSKLMILGDCWSEGPCDWLALRTSTCYQIHLCISTSVPKGSRLEKWIHLELTALSLLSCKSASVEQGRAGV